jgi:hypothetical protein
MNQQDRIDSLPQGTIIIVTHGGGKAVYHQTASRSTTNKQADRELAVCIEQVENEVKRQAGEGGDKK